MAPDLTTMQLAFVNAGLITPAGVVDRLATLDAVERYNKYVNLQKQKMKKQAKLKVDAQARKPNQNRRAPPQPQPDSLPKQLQDFSQKVA